MTDSLTLHLPEGMNYSCVECGKSCSMFEEVVLDAKSLRTVEAIPYQDLLQQKDKPAWKPSPLDGTRTILCKKENGACVFFREEDKLCAIHATHGLEPKPQTCKDFPYRFVETPDGLHVGLSFACTAVLENAGKPLAEQRQELAAHYPVTNSKRDGGQPVAFTSRHEVSWDAYTAVEQDLRALLRREDATIGECLAAQAVYLDMAVPLLRESRRDSLRQETPATPQEAGGQDRFPVDSGSAPDTEVINTVHTHFVAPGDAAKLFRLVRKPRPSPALQRAFLGLMTAFRQNLYIKGRRPNRVSTLLRIMRHYMTHMMKLGGVNLEALGAKFNYDAFERLGLDWENVPGVRPLLLRFFEHCIVRKDLLLGENVWIAQRFMLMHYALIRWYAVGAAAVAGRDAITLEDVKEAIRHVERHYVYHTTFGMLFEKFPLLGMVLDSITRRPSYGASMIITPV